MLKNLQDQECIYFSLGETLLRLVLLDIRGEAGMSLLARVGNEIIISDGDMTECRLI